VRPPDASVVLTPTIAINRGEAKVAQCAQCGCLVCWAGKEAKRLGNCPACGRATWWGQQLPVGPYR
jgi:NAD-dependent SIR2 family protein deacetylase